MNRRHFLQTGATLAAAAAAGHAHPHHHFVDPSSPSSGAGSAASNPSGPIISGQAEFRYEYVPEKLALPPQVKMKNGHGLCHDSKGNIYFTFEPEAVEEQTRCLVRFAPDGTGATLLGLDNALAHGVPHGLNISVENDGQAVLYHANNAATVHKTTLDGRILWTQTWSPQMGNYKPTDAAAPPHADRLLVADGYGSSMIHALKTADGIYAGKSWGGLGSAHGEFNCPHGITYDPRRQLLLTADRGNKRLEYFTLTGFYDSTIEAKEITAPCNADIWGDYVLVPDLNGPCVILDKDNHVVSVIEVGQLLGDRGFKHPHDAIWLDNGDIAVCTWNPGRLGYWRRLPA
ncbi:putative Peptidylglycine monooxygenase-like protein [Verrucomicrobia bacterium]|nr:putative Peptidylglycine monooxygenase-like protein [Verrucomicrobiota bacterium]